MKTTKEKEEMEVGDAVKFNDDYLSISNGHNVAFRNLTFKIIKISKEIHGTYCDLLLDDKIVYPFINIDNLTPVT